MHRSWWSLPSLLLLSTACTRSPPSESARAALAPGAVAEHAIDALFLEPGGSGRLRYLGVDRPESGRAGAKLELRHLFEIEQPFSEDARIFVHGETAAQGRVAVDDHVPIGGEVPLRSMKAGERWRDVHQLELPPNLNRGTLELYFGLFRGAKRMSLEAEAGANDGRDRLRIGAVAVEGAPSPDLPMVEIRRTDDAIEVDGVLDEPAWARAEVLEFHDTMGRERETRFPTRLRLLYDDAFLYVAFEAEDRDISERYSKRDDPIYEHETVELFLMPHVRAPELGPYVELQASPTGVIFDASFTGRRQGMNTAFDAGQTVATRRRGTLNDDQDDEGWVSEWKVPFTGIRGVKKAPEAGEEWRMNAFRIEKFNEGGQLQGEYTAWSPPRVGDFHATDRFGRLVFAEGE